VLKRFADVDRRSGRHANGHSRQGGVLDRAVRDEREIDRPEDRREARADAASRGLSNFCALRLVPLLIVCLLSAQAVVFVRPTAENIELLKPLLKTPRYKEYHICESSFCEWTFSVAAESVAADNFVVMTC
jgi:hypothetical protein